jgi:Protein of unknown function (DUF3379).
MNCHEFRTAIGADPSSQNADLRVHEQTCAACARYRKQMQDMDRLIHKALTVPIEERVASQSNAPRISQKRRTISRWQLAASLLASIMIVASIWVGTTRESLAEQIVTHTAHESFAMVRTDKRVDAKVLANILAKSGVGLREDVADVSYASSCPFRGHEVPHLVVQTDRGPVTVLVLANEPQTKAMERFSEGGYEGVIVPAPRGVLAVLGKDAPIEQVVDKLSWSIDYW